MSVLNQVFTAYKDGHAALLLTGRSLYDLVAEANGKIRPLREALRLAVRQSYGMLLVTYSKAEGLDWDASRLPDRDRNQIQELFRTHRLLDLTQDETEVARVIRGISALSRASTENLRWQDGSDLRFCVLFEFSEHLMPGTLTNGTQTEAQVVAIELTHLTAQSQALRQSGNLILFHAREGMLDGLVCGAMHHVRLTQPDDAEKQVFLAGGMSLYDKARFADGLAPAVVRLTANTPNRGLESLLRASHRSGRAITTNELLAQKIRDVSQISEGTMAVLDVGRVKDVELCGVAIQTAAAILMRYAQALREGCRSMPTSVLLVGPPGSGKTDLALLAARTAGVPAYQLLSPKTSLVGETERRARLQQEILDQWIPAIGFVDEVTEAFPMERSDFDGDNGASRAVMAAWLTGLSDSRRAGTCLIVSTTNCPWRMSAAMRSRFVVLPVLHPVRTDYPGIICAIARRMVPGTTLSSEDPQITEAARIFFEKGATPRHIQSALANALLVAGSLSPRAVCAAAEDLRTGIDRVSSIYTDLWAIKAATSRSFLPWAADPSHYPYPQHLEGVVDPQTGEINERELDKRIEEFRTCANV